MVWWVGSGPVKWKVSWGSNLLLRSLKVHHLEISFETETKLSLWVKPCWKVEIGKFTKFFPSGPTMVWTIPLTVHWSWLDVRKSKLFKLSVNEIFWIPLSCASTKKHRKSAKLPWRRNIEFSFWSLSFVFLSFCLFVSLSFCLSVCICLWFCFVVHHNYLPIFADPKINI